MNDNNLVANGRLSPKKGALIAGFAIMIMVPCAPLAYFYFLPQVLTDDPAKTLSLLQTVPQPFFNAISLFFITYVMDLLALWGLYNVFRSANPALAQLVALSRLLYTGMAFVTLGIYVSVYGYVEHYAASSYLTELQAQMQVMSLLNVAKSMELLALSVFSLHLWILALTVWRSSIAPKWLSIPLCLAGFAYIGPFFGSYFFPAIDYGMLTLLGIAELVFMFWLLFFGFRADQKT